MPTPLNKRLVTRGELDAAVSGDYLTAGGFRKWTSGKWYGPPMAGTTTGSTQPSVFRVIAVPVWVPHVVTVDAVYCEVTTLSATAGCKIGLYGSTDSDTPGSLILDVGSVDVTSTGGKTITFTPQELPKGLLWLALATNDTVGFRRIVGSVPGYPTQSAGLYAGSVRNALNTYSNIAYWPSLPSSLGSSDPSGGAPLIQLRVK